MASNARRNWLDSIGWQMDFQRRAGPVRRRDLEFDWDHFRRSPSGRMPRIRRMAKQVLYRIGRADMPVSPEWVHAHADALWETRSLLADEMSRLLFDSTLVLNATGYRNYYFPRIDFDDFVEVLDERDFDSPGFPSDYLGVPLREFELGIPGRNMPASLRMITTRPQIRLLNSYRQYFVSRGGMEILPRPGDVVFDCGACIGEIALLFAALAAPRGEVHLFDPMPLHTRFCQLQAGLNPAFGDMFHINTLAIGARTNSATVARADTNRIVPNAVSEGDFPCTSIDDYVKTGPGRVDFVKMDIEGAEMDALAGAAQAIQEFRPRLAISGYHRPEDLWEIPARIVALNPGYRLAFGHHTPIGWESVFYAVDAGAGKLCR